MENTQVEDQRENPAILWERFSRSRALLQLIARRILDSPERAEDAIAACCLKTFRQAPRFAEEIAFRRWLVRVLMGEALLILHRVKGRSSEHNARSDSDGYQSKTIKKGSVQPEPRPLIV